MHISQKRNLRGNFKFLRSYRFWDLPFFALAVLTSFAEPEQDAVDQKKKLSRKHNFPSLIIGFEMREASMGRECMGRVFLSPFFIFGC